MTTSFKAKFPLKALNSIKEYTREAGKSPELWAKQQATGLKLGDIVLCFSPLVGLDGNIAEVVTTALMLVFAVEDGKPACILVTEDFYVTDSSENIFRERASALASQGHSFSYVLIPFTGTIASDRLPFMSSMRRWGSGGSRNSPPLGLPDPLAAFLSCLGVTIPLSPILSISVLASSLVKGPDGPSTPDLRPFYARISNFEFQTTGSAPAAASSSSSISSITVVEDSKPEPKSSIENPFVSATEDAPLVKSETTSVLLPDLDEVPTVGKSLADLTSTSAATAEVTTAPVSSAASVQAATTSSSASVPATAAKSSFDQPHQSFLDSSHSLDSDSTKESSYASSFSDDFAKKVAELETSEAEEDLYDDGDDERRHPRSPRQPLNVRSRLEARLAGKLPKGMDTFSETNVPAFRSKIDPTSPVIKLVSNIRQQVNIAADNMEYRVSTHKARLLDQLVSNKHNLNEKEQNSLRALEEIKSNYQKKLEESTLRSRDELAKVASEGSSRVRAFQAYAVAELQKLLEAKQTEISRTALEAKQKVQDAVATGKEDLTKSVSRSQQTLRGLVGTTEVNLNQIQTQGLKSMDERIDGFRAQSQILTEGIALSVESLAEAAKLQGQQSQDEVAKRLDDLSTEAVKSLREQTVKAEMECTKLIDKLSREKLLPALQERRKYAVELAGSFQDEFADAIQQLLDAKLAEFDPLIRANSEFCHATLKDFRGRWLSTLEEHQESLEVIHVNLERKVSEYMAQARTKVESIQDISRVAETVLNSPELIRTRDETCLKFDIIAREHISRAYAQMGDRVQVQKSESLDELVYLRERAESALRTRGEEGRTRIRGALKNAMQKIQELQAQYTS